MMADEPRMTMQDRESESFTPDRTTVVLAGVAVAVVLAGLLAVFSTNDPRGMPSIAQRPAEEVPAMQAPAVAVPAAATTGGSP